MTAAPSPPSPAPSAVQPRQSLASWLPTLLFGLAVTWLAYRFLTVGAGSAYVTEVDGRWVDSTRNEFTAGDAVFSPSRTLGIWTAALLTLAAISFLYKDNVVYKLTESVFVGVSAAYWMVVAFWTVLVPNLFAKLGPAWTQAWALPGLSTAPDPERWWYLIPLILGIMLLWRLAPRGAWIARWPLAFIIGTTAGLRLVHFLQADFLSQIRNGSKPLLKVHGDQILIWPSIENILILGSVLATLVYFFFSIEHKGTVGKVSRVGVWVLMITFGASFANTVMARIALLGIRFEFLFDDWLWLIDPQQRRL